jgi:carbon starvation protein CstA
MASFIISLVVLLAGYFIYGTFVEKVFGVDERRSMPCDTLRDGVDFTPMPTWKVYTVQFLNIAGTGPIFGALMGILYGPAAFLWIVFGCLLGGAMHDYMAGMISIRRDGASLPEIIGDELGSSCRLVMRVVTLVLMVCVGASFIMIPAGLMTNLMASFTSSALLTSNLFWTVLMFAFYLCVTVFSVSKIMGNIYPVFGVALLVMAVLIGVCIFTEPGMVPSISTAFSDHYPVREGVTPLFPGLFITIACGAVSGFHATQSPMMGRCLKNEKYGLRCFYGAMVTEGVVALIWAAASIKYAGSYQHLYDLMSAGGTQKVNPAIVVDMMCRNWLGTAGLVLAVLGIVAAPISTGGSAFRAARLILADFSGYGQKTILRRVLLSVPLFLVAVMMLNVSSFKVLWLYVSWFNQVLATFTFFTIAHWLRHRTDGGGLWPKYSWLIAFVPAVFMCSVSACFILIDYDNGFGLQPLTGYLMGGIFTLLTTTLFLKYQFKR